MVSKKKKSSKRISRKQSKRFKQSLHNVKCKKILQQNIKAMIKEYKKKRWNSPKQAIAVAYSKTRRAGCTI